MAEVNIQSLEERIGEVLSEWNVVGGAVSILKDSDIVSCRGYGRKSSDLDDPVDQDTIFGIGSNTKSFTAAGLALLVDEGKASWDDPVIQHLPDFQLVDPWVTQQITLRDMLSHRSGLGRSMRILYNHEFDLAEVIRRLRYMPLQNPFRDAFGYNNYHFMVIGRVIEVLSGLTWPEFMQKRIFEPLGMKSSFADLQQMQGQTNLSAAHDDISDHLLPHDTRLFSQQTVIPWSDVGNQPAGGISSSASDMTHWMGMLLSGGQYNGQPFLSQKVIREMTLPVATFKEPLQSDLGFLAALDPEINFYTYGLGWFVLDYKGRLMFFHGGQIHGFNSIVAFFPQENLGYTVLTNAHHTFAHAALTFHIADAFLGGSQRNWSQQILGLAQSVVQGAKAQLEERQTARKTGTPSSLPLSAYQGVYENPFVGKTSVTLENGSLWMRYGTAFDGKLEHWEEDTFLAMWKDRTFDPNRVHFEVENGEVVSLIVDPEGKFIKLTEEG
jgi:CubicO group peptidase (beta-lactamase class C family)